MIRIEDQQQLPQRQLQQQQQGQASPPPRLPPRSGSSSNLSSAQKEKAPLSPWRPASVVLHADCLFLRPPPPSSSSFKGPVELQPVAVLPRFGTEQLLDYLRAQQPPVAITAVAPSPSSRALLAAARADPTMAPLLAGVHVLLPLSSQEEGSVVVSENNNEEDGGGPEALLSFVEKRACGSNGTGLSGPVLVVAPSRAPSPAPEEEDEQLQQQQQLQQLQPSPSAGLRPLRFVAAILPEPPAAATNGHPPHGSSLPLPPPPLRQEGAGSVATAVEWARLGLPPLVVDVQNPPFLWPRDYERHEGRARCVEARWWDPQHGQLNLVLGRGVHAGNVLEAVAAETHGPAGAADRLGGLLECVFVTVRHDFGLMARLLADGYRIHHAAGGGTEVVLLRRCVKNVEVPTAGTHIVRSKVILFRRKARLGTGTGGGSSTSNGAGGGGGGGVVRSRPMGGPQALSPSQAAGPPSPGQGYESPSKALLLAGMRRRSRSVGSHAEAAGWEEGDEEDVEIFLFRRRAKGIWKMPGGHVEMKELADEAAVRELREETGYACRVLGMVALTERKDVGKKWGCSQLMYTFAAEWRESEMRLDDATTREGRWFPLGEMDALVAKDSVTLDPPLKKVWPSFRARDRWFTHHAECVDAGYESRKRYYMAAPAHPQASPDTVADGVVDADAAASAEGMQQLALAAAASGSSSSSHGAGERLSPGRGAAHQQQRDDGGARSSLSSLHRLSLSESCTSSSMERSSSDWSRG